MAGLGDIVQKAFYMGVGIASYAGEQASQKLADLRTQAQKLADEMVKRGEMTTEEASKFVDDLIKQAQTTPMSQVQTNTKENTKSEPRLIEILEDDAESNDSDNTRVDNLRQQVESLQEQLRSLQRD